jgi:heme A synthase
LSAAIAFVHDWLARVVIIYAVVLALWGTYLYFRRDSVTGGFRSSFLVLAGVTVLQSLAGAASFVAGNRPFETLHLVYGAFAILFLPGSYLYAHGGSARREAVVLAGACWIVSIAFFRGFATG